MSRLLVFVALVLGSAAADGWPEWQVGLKRGDGDLLALKRGDGDLLALKRGDGDLLALKRGDGDLLRA